MISGQDYIGVGVGHGLWLVSGMLSERVRVSSEASLRAISAAGKSLGFDFSDSRSRACARACAEGRRSLSGAAVHPRPHGASDHLPRRRRFSAEPALNRLYLRSGGYIIARAKRLRGVSRWKAACREEIETQLARIRGAVVRVIETIPHLDLNNDIPFLRFGASARTPRSPDAGHVRQ